MVIIGQIFSPGILDAIQAHIDSASDHRWSDVISWVCDFLKWVDSKGRPKLTSAKKALLLLEKKGFLRLPERQKRPICSALSRKDSVEFTPTSAKPDLRSHRDLRLDLVQSKSDRDLWWHLIRNYHYLKDLKVVGPQIKYLIRSGEQVLGALCFSSASWSVAVRDNWIGWNSAERQRGLPHVLNNSRFLILPTVHVKNLASKILSMATKGIASDWMAQYGVEPLLLESFVDAHHCGTSYLAANWKELGLTSGRGRNDQLDGSETQRKKVFVFQLRDLSVLKTVACQTPELNAESQGRPMEALIQGPVHQGEDWAANEFGTADLGDPRLNRRLLVVARDCGNHPNGSLPEACEGDLAKFRGACRFFNNPNVTMNKILQPHQEASLRRSKEESIVLAAQDTSTLNYSSHQNNEGMGPIASRKLGANGLMLHTTLLMNTQGVPLGILDSQCWARPEGEKESKSTPSESQKWFNSYEKLCEAQRLLPNTRFISVGDREADIYSLFERALREDGLPDLLIRAKNNRQVESEDGELLWDKVGSEDAIGTMEVQVAKKKGGVAKRRAVLEVRSRMVTLKPPSTAPKGSKNLDVWAIHAWEPSPPTGTEALEWMLLTTCPVQTLSKAEETLKHYGLRWQIEVFFRTLKTGCAIEDRMFPVRDTLEACLAVDMVVAWRVMYLVKMGRETPDLPCTVLFDEHEWEALVIRVEKTTPSTPPPLGKAVRMIAKLGGFLYGDKSFPGPETIWKGLEKLQECTEMMLIIQGRDRPVFEMDDGSRVQCGE